MPKMVTCLSDGKPVSIEQALIMRDDATKRNVANPLFHCDECGLPVGPHTDGTTGAQAHFEHEAKNTECPYFK